jgi:hypothetical protein
MQRRTAAIASSSAVRGRSAIRDSKLPLAPEMYAAAAITGLICSFWAVVQAFYSDRNTQSRVATSRISNKETGGTARRITDRTNGGRLDCVARAEDQGLARSGRSPPAAPAR